MSANAGSGKTKVLVDRIIRLLLEGVPSEHILCLTYTKAAASEMLVRLQKIINSWAIIAEDELQKQLEAILEKKANIATIQAARNLFFNFHDASLRLPILTIHSFCQGLLSNFPHEAGLNPAFKLANDEHMAELINMARIAILAEAVTKPDEEWSKMLDYMLDNLSEHSFNQWVTKINSLRYKAQYLLQNDDINDLAIHMLYAKCDFEQGCESSQLLQKYLTASDDFHAILQNILPIFQSGSVNDGKMAQKIETYLCAEKTQSSLHDFAFAILTNEGTQYKNVPTAPTKKKLLPKLSYEWAEISKRAEEYFKQYHMLNSVKLSHALMLVAKKWLTHYQAIKAQHSYVDYYDLLEKVHDLLQDPELSNWVLYKLDSKITHLLIDEAQDTSGLQWKITQALTAELFAGQGANGISSLFVVGDEKQSIFGFQGAEAQQFMQQSLDYEARAAAIGEELHRVPLSVSFRSVATILQFVDIVFANQGWEHQSFRGQQNGRVCLHPCLD